jgi:hypothetical protein
MRVLLFSRWSRVILKHADARVLKGYTPSFKIDTLKRKYRYGAWATTEGGVVVNRESRRRTYKKEVCSCGTHSCIV